MRFKKGDRFKVKESGLSGEIVGVLVNTHGSMYQVSWDHFDDIMYYSCDDGDEIWETSEPLSGGVLDHYLTISKSNECNHSWRSYNGFTSTYEYCEKCDTKRG